ncbi:hypothetical protein NU688_26060 [Variovorax sp. ZS18.2.2]|uniref:hypothetical protein n=1 Tax=Variovorax sp. ZS18.2.2 TaxID=2971255 RepID=UPI0021513D29|nr:hypothetical protein [Variovorax sp. ZS18.2.2]MCR6479647.1 hypothetical protein [Variovorax sp. ZS18.2.2]
MKIDERCIRQTEAEMARLKNSLSEAFGKRGGSPSARAAWKAAAEDFNRYESPLFALWSDEARDGILQGKGAWREGAMRYLALSPRFHRSGYLRDRLCHLLKRCELSGNEREELRGILLETLVRRPSTGRFRHDCQLAARWADDAFIARVRELVTRKDGWTRGRAQRMLDVVEQRKRLRSKES